MWQPIHTAPIDQRILLWNDETEEICIGHRPLDAPYHGCVIVDMTASYADAWMPLPEPPADSELEDD